MKEKLGSFGAIIEWEAGEFASHMQAEMVVKLRWKGCLCSTWNEDFRDSMLHILPISLRWRNLRRFVLSDLLTLG